MASSRLAYLTALALCGLLYLTWGQWLQWLALAIVLALPWVSLAVSIGAICRFRAAPAGPEVLLQGEPGQLYLMGSCSLPVPPFRGRLRLKSLLTGEQRLYRPEKGLPTAHCGGLRVTMEKTRICDYLGLFAFPVKCREEKTILIRPKPLPVPALEEPLQRISHMLQPSIGFSGEQELRPYQPGDSLKQIHWKLSAKTGTLLLRQNMEPVQGAVLLTMELSGNAEMLDRKLGRLWWLGTRLLQLGVAFFLEVSTGEGVLSLEIGDRAALEKAVDHLLCCNTCPRGCAPAEERAGFLHYHIGGEADG